MGWLEPIASIMTKIDCNSCECVWTRGIRSKIAGIPIKLSNLPILDCPAKTSSSTQSHHSTDVRYGGHLRPYLSVTCDPTPLNHITRSLATLPLFTAHLRPYLFLLRGPYETRPGHLRPYPPLLGKTLAGHLRPYRHR